MTHEHWKLEMIQNIIEGNPVAYKIRGNNMESSEEDKVPIFVDCKNNEEKEIDKISCVCCGNIFFTILHEDEQIYYKCEKCKNLYSFNTLNEGAINNEQKRND